MLTDFTSNENDDGPVTWVRGYPLYAAHVIVVIFVVSMLVTSLLLTVQGGALLNAFPFSSAAVLNGQVWRLVTYGLVNPPSLWFVIDMAMIIWFGREVERTFGRRKFLALYGSLYLLAPIVLTVVGLWWPTQLVGQTGGFALFVAFATLYPGAPIFFNVLAKWAALVLVGIYSLMGLSSHDWTGLISLWSTTGFAFAFVRFEQGHLSLPKIPKPRRRPRLRVLPNDNDIPVKPHTPSAHETSMREIDALLDKIAQSGIHSLTDAERAKLEDAREDLLRRHSDQR
ncbi:hypothetical protein DB347_04990 [Opitutaceae bacterium EW11]|nr:hypothetical protein DB347_04990 [Opitutaceae bacterium EW11]